MTFLAAGARGPAVRWPLPVAPVLVAPAVAVILFGWGWRAVLRSTLPPAAVPAP